MRSLGVSISVVALGFLVGFGSGRAVDSINGWRRDERFEREQSNGGESIRQLGGALGVSLRAADVRGPELRWAGIICPSRNGAVHCHGSKSQ